EGWTFNGWSVVKGGENCSTESADLSSAELNISKVEGDCGFNAGYTKNEPDVKKIKVTFAAFGGKGTVSNPSSELEIGFTIGSRVTANDGYKFKAWRKMYGDCELVQGAQLTNASIAVKAAGTKDCTYLAYFEEATTSKTTVEFWVTNSVGTLTIDGVTTDGTTAHKSKEITTGSQVNVSAAEASGGTFQGISVMEGSCRFENGDTGIKTKTGKLTVTGDKCRVMAYINPTGGTTGKKFQICTENGTMNETQSVEWRWNSADPTNIWAKNPTIEHGSFGSYNESKVCTYVNIPASPIQIQFRDLTHHYTGTTAQCSQYNTGGCPTPSFYLNGELGGPNGSQGSLLSGGYYTFDQYGRANEGCNGQVVNSTCNGTVYYIKTITIKNGDTIYLKRYNQNGNPQKLP
ncbi:hypothetical protein J6E39_08980, partial [bacterium]|nr:hypothetical protein [bacterium]